MEKKKLLLVSVSVGLFLVIIIGAAIVAFSPRSRSAVEAISAQSALQDATSSEVAQVGTGAAQTTSPTGIELAPPPVPPAGTAPVYPPVNENVIYINGENAQDAVKVERLGDGNTKTYITIPGASGAVPTVSFETPKSAAPEPTAAAAAAVTAPKSGGAVRAAPQPAPKKAAPAVIPKQEIKKSSRNDYWVQVGSYLQKSRADDTKIYLSEKKGLGSIIVDSTVNGKTVYRVRLGPYTSQAEATYWLSLIKEIDGMKDSLVWKSTSL
jgi:DedD protein